MYPMPHSSFFPSFSQSPMTPMLTQGMMHQAMPFGASYMLRPSMVGQTGGMLGKLLGGGPASGGMSNILTMLQHAQRALGVVQTVGPMIQQYGPLVRSIPALLRIMNSPESTSETETNDHLTNDGETSGDEENKKIKKSPKVTVSEGEEKPNKVPQKEKKRTPQKIGNMPAPKLYI